MEFGGYRGGQADDTPFAKTYTMQPWVPVYNVGGDFAGSQAQEGGRDKPYIRYINKVMTGPVCSVARLLFIWK